MTDKSHAFHFHLPDHYKDDSGVPYVTTFAQAKGREFVQLVRDIELTPDLYSCVHNNADTEDSPLNALIKRCNRLYSQLTALENLKALNVISPLETCEVVLKLLKLVTCTITYEHSDDDDISGLTRQACLHFENVGYIKSFTFQDGKVTRTDSSETLFELSPSRETLMQEISEHQFALPSPTRDIILSALLNLLSNKSHLRSFSNASIYTPCTEAKERHLLVLHWKVFLRMLMRCAPFLDERVESIPSLDSNSRQSTIIKHTVQLIRDARHFFDQGLLDYVEDGTSNIDDVASLNSTADTTAKQVWDMVNTDILYHSHTHACYRGAIMLYLFTPTRCTSQFYDEIMPKWMEAWTNIDRCPEFDFLWLTLFSRARKYAFSYDWTQLRQRILTHAQYWLQLPIGGAALDKSFPHTSNPRSRSCPSRLKAFAGVASSYEEGIDFVAKLSKILVAMVGNNDGNDPDENGTGSTTFAEGTSAMLRFFAFAKPYMNPSNIGEWTFTLGAFLHYFAYELCCRVGYEAGRKVLHRDHPQIQEAILTIRPGVHRNPIPHADIVALLDALLPLCQQALYSKNGHVGRAGESAMLYLVQIDPVHVAPYFLDFAIQALDVSAVNLSHQAPSALSALNRLLQPSLRTNPTVLLSRLPLLLRLSLAGIDSNDQNKTIRTLILYRALTSWIPVGGRPEQWPQLTLPSMTTDMPMSDGGTVIVGQDLHKELSSRWNDPDYIAAIQNLPDFSVIKQAHDSENHSLDMLPLMLDEAIMAMSDWALEFLERVYGLLRASGEREKAGKSSAGVASRHTSADVHQARNFSRVLKECLQQTFVSMDEEVYNVAVRSVTRFLSEETLPLASKDTSLLCQAVAAARYETGSDGDKKLSSKGLDSIVTILLDDIKLHSAKTVNYRIRCLAGAVKSAGRNVVKHRDAIASALRFALSFDDRHVFKTGCKLLRHLLATLCECYPVSTASIPQTYTLPGDDNVYVGRSAQLYGESVDWHVPDKACLEFAHEILQEHVQVRLDGLKEVELMNDNTSARSVMLNSIDTNSLRQTLRIIRYAMRGGASVFLESTCKESVGKNTCIPHETASYKLIEAATPSLMSDFLRLRGQVCVLVLTLASAISSETLYPDEITKLSEDDRYRKSIAAINADAKVCREVCDIALLLLTRRGAHFRSQESRTVWKAQKQLATDYGLAAEVSYLVEAYQASSTGSFANGKGLYKDGEDSGKSIPPRILMNRIQLYHNSLQRNASFEITKQLRKLSSSRKTTRVALFQAKEDLSGMLEHMEATLQSDIPHPLDCYEGILDCLFSLCCHSNTKVRASAISVVDYAMTRFGWLVGARIPRLLSGVALEDENENGKFGMPSCANLALHLNAQGKRKRLTEAIKGICAVLGLSKCTKQVLGSERFRAKFATTLCNAENFIALLPPEEMQKLVMYIHTVFTPFRSKYYFLLRTSPSDEDNHRDVISMSLNILQEKQSTMDDDSDVNDNRSVGHWRKALLACWFLVNTLDFDDMKRLDEGTLSTVWKTCIYIIENEAGQPLQKVALGLFGKLTSMSSNERANAFLNEKFASESFCKNLCKALFYDHKEDSNVGGGHDAQWSTGVEDMVKDTTRFIAKKSLFPFQRTGQSLGSFKVSHCQLLYSCLCKLEKATSVQAAECLLEICNDYASRPPSEDQRNLQITSAEIFSGACRYLMQAQDKTKWDELILPQLEKALVKIPFSLSGAYFDALRYALQYSSPNDFLPLTTWLVNKIDNSLWQPQSGTDDMNETQSNGLEGFTAQSRWLYLLQAAIIELDESNMPAYERHSCWYASALVDDTDIIATAQSIDDMVITSSDETWKIINEVLMGRLTNALGHPFESCRNHISRLLFRICYCHRKRMRVSKSRGPSRSNSSDAIDLLSDEANDPSKMIVTRFLDLDGGQWTTFIEKYNAYNTARLFIQYCIHIGEAKFEFSDYVIPLIWISFLALDSKVEDEITTNLTSSQEENSAKRTLEAEVIKAFKFVLAETSVIAVISYGKREDIDFVLDACEKASTHETWHVRHASAHFLRCFQDAHKFLYSQHHSTRTMNMITNLLSDDRREVSTAAMSALIGILAASPESVITQLVKKYSLLASRSKLPKKKIAANGISSSDGIDPTAGDKELKRARDQQTSVYFLCASVLSQPYDTPHYVPPALAAISKHSFERNAPLHVRDIVKRCCAEYKKTHMSDNWELHRRMFTQEQVEALEDVVSSPHYYA